MFFRHHNDKQSPMNRRSPRKTTNRTLRLERLDERMTLSASPLMPIDSVSSRSTLMNPVAIEAKSVQVGVAAIASMSQPLSQPIAVSAATGGAGGAGGAGGSGGIVLLTTPNSATANLPKSDVVTIPGQNLGADAKLTSGDQVQKTLSASDREMIVSTNAQPAVQPAYVTTPNGVSESQTVNVYSFDFALAKNSINPRENVQATVQYKSIPVGTKLVFTNLSPQTIKMTIPGAQNAANECVYTIPQNNGSIPVNITGISKGNFTIAIRFTMVQTSPVGQPLSLPITIPPATGGAGGSGGAGGAINLTLRSATTVIGANVVSGPAKPIIFYGEGGEVLEDGDYGLSAGTNKRIGEILENIKVHLADGDQDAVAASLKELEGILKQAKKDRETADKAAKEAADKAAADKAAADKAAADKAKEGGTAK